MATVELMRAAASDDETPCGSFSSVSAAPLYPGTFVPKERKLGWRKHIPCPFLSDLEQQFHEARAQATEDGETPPTPRAATHALCLLWEAKPFLPSLPTGGYLYGDGDGGVRVDWAHGARQVRLVVHAADSDGDYLYHQEGDEYGVEAGLSPEKVAGWLRWLTGQIK